MNISSSSYMSTLYSVLTAMWAESFTGQACPCRYCTLWLLIPVITIAIHSKLFGSDFMSLYKQWPSESEHCFFLPCTMYNLWIYIFSCSFLTYSNIQATRAAGYSLLFVFCTLNKPFPISYRFIPSSYVLYILSVLLVTIYIAHKLLSFVVNLVGLLFIWIIITWLLTFSLIYLFSSLCI